MLNFVFFQFITLLHISQLKMLQFFLPRGTLSDVLGASTSLGFNYTAAVAVIQTAFTTNFLHMILKSFLKVFNSFKQFSFLSFNYLEAAIQTSFTVNFLHTSPEQSFHILTKILYPILWNLAITPLVKSSEAKSKAFLPGSKLALVVSCNAHLL